VYCIASHYLTTRLYIHSFNHSHVANQPRGRFEIFMKVVYLLYTYSENSNKWLNLEIQEVEEEVEVGGEEEGEEEVE
jgi:hypothetical protein